MVSNRYRDGQMETDNIKVGQTWIWIRGTYENFVVMICCLNESEVITFRLNHDAPEIIGFDDAYRHFSLDNSHYWERI